MVVFLKESDTVQSQVKLNKMKFLNKLIKSELS